MASEPVNVNEFQELARKVLPKMYYDFYSGGAEDQLRPRVLIDVSRINMSTTVLGYKIPAPILIAPISMHHVAQPEERKLQPERQRHVLLFVSNSTIEEAIVLTVDSPRLCRREADIKNKMIAPKIKNLEGLLKTEVDSDDGSNLEAYANRTYDASLCWKDIEWLKSITSLPILVKGILTHEDGKTITSSFNNFLLLCLLIITTRKAVEAGVNGIVVSNHGGRQLDYAPPTISVLDEVTIHFH
ncbi:Alpha-hydroxy acid dehydrogenase, FMN-dependent [Parasponia andersonii]|uniref:(S)-2-hydroxy-acid oxidase n=1 Tax=Parasponia andersonii TaxID=3476 RepID=A0A2P5B448_PARAD|nr:Alpha-hydroxy acid dehydrogenase, FMN-dependent [Parasponia andersonii]